MKGENKNEAISQEGEPPFTSSGVQTQTHTLLNNEQQKLLLLRAGA